MDNAYYAHILKEVGLLLQIKGANRFKVRAYENASRALSHLDAPIHDTIEGGEDLTALDGIGKSIASDLVQIYETGTCEVRTDLIDALEPGVLDLFKIQGVGPKKIKMLYDALGISNLEMLREAAMAQKLRELSGFGAKTEEKILAEIERLESHQGRTPLPAALRLAASFKDTLAQIDGVERVAIAGSIRRQRETTGDIDLLVASSADPIPIMEAFTRIPGVSEILVQGEKKTSVRSVQGIQIDLRIVAPEAFGAALHYFTGSKEHHIKLRTRAKKEGLKINEYGVFREGDETPVAAATEHDLFEALGLSFIPPELREGFDEIERATAQTLPHLIEMSDVRGDLHMHTIESDGEATILEMAHAAKELGYDYIALTDHSQVLTVAHGMTPARFAAHIESIREANEEIEDFTILSGIEVDILKDGTLDMDEDLLRACDWVVGSVHIHQAMTQEEMTHRLLRALDTGLLSMLGHPTGRILGGRGGYTYDFDAVMHACRAKRVAVEINGSSGRLDFNAAHAARAKEAGVKIVLGSDAHSTRGLTGLSFAIGQARRAGLSAPDVLNALGAKELLEAVR